MFAGSLTNCLNIEDLRSAAKRRAHKMVFDYIDGGADDEWSLTNNTKAFESFDLMYKTLVGVDEVDTSTTLFGEKLNVPFFCSPAAGNRLFHTEGERAVAIAAGEIGTAYCLSTLSSISIEEIASVCTGPKWFQIYVWKDRALVKEMIERAKAAGFTAIILTVDFPVTGNRERDPRNGFTIPPTYGVRQALDALRAPMWTWVFLTSPPIRYANLSSDTAAVTLNSFVSDQLHSAFYWKDVEWLLGAWNGNAMIKGVVRADDARRAVSTGFNGIMISNHGGRQLDYSPAPIDVLPGISEAIDGDAELVLDGGIRRGTDILKALSLGAKAVSFARPYLYGLAAGGLPGVRRALELLQSDFRTGMKLAGVTRIEDVDSSFAVRRMT